MIENIANNESGLSVRGKLNEVIDNSNNMASVWDEIFLERNPRVVLYDSFIGSNGSIQGRELPSGGTWDVVSNSVLIDQNELRTDTTYDPFSGGICVADISQDNDKTAYFDLQRFSNTRDCGIIISYEDSNNWWAISYRRSSIALLQVDDGVENVIDETTVNSNFNITRFYYKCYAGWKNDGQIIWYGQNNINMDSPILLNSTQRTHFSAGADKFGFILGDIRQRISNIQVWEASA